jgi:hypothetical protein
VGFQDRNSPSFHHFGQGLITSSLQLAFGMSRLSFATPKKKKNTNKKVEKIESANYQHHNLKPEHN